MTETKPPSSELLDFLKGEDEYVYDASNAVLVVGDEEIPVESAVIR